MMIFSLLLVLSGAVIAFIIFQARATKNNAIRLPEAKGQSVRVEGARYSLLHIGESTVAGVGVKNLKDGLTANIINALESKYSTTLDWQVLGTNGATISDAHSFEPLIKQPDILIVTFGVNDTTKFTSKAVWLKGLRACVDKFSGIHSNVFFTAVPPMQKFPLLPSPLNWILGLRSAWLNTYLKEICDSNGWHYIQLDFESSTSLMAEDGYHPNAKGYQVWGNAIAEKITHRIKVSSVDAR